MPHEFSSTSFEGHERCNVRFEGCNLRVRVNCVTFQLDVEHYHHLDCCLECLLFISSEQLRVDFSDVWMHH